jgi:pimeloyl-ACP methyl ester carboxylesterase
VGRHSAALVAVALCAAVGAAGATTAPSVPVKGCAAGSTPATIAGKRVCLKAGTSCEKRRDGAYHRYRFHCHSGRLVRFAAPAPKPAPPKPTPPTLPEPPLPPAGALVDVGGYRLHLECAGIGSPTVVIETGQIATRLNYRKVQYALSTENRVCTYDRPGTSAPVSSASDQRPASVAPTAETFARELHTMLANANVPGPYLLAGTSLGGLLISDFTARYPADVVGLVFIDAIAPGSVAAWLTESNQPPEPWDGRSDVGLLERLTFDPRPVVVLTTAQPGEIPAFRRSATNILIAQAPQYGHLVFLDAPGLAYEAIRVAASALRTGGTLPPCAQTALPRSGALC